MRRKYAINARKCEKCAKKRGTCTYDFAILCRFMSFGHIWCIIIYRFRLIYRWGIPPGDILLFSLFVSFKDFCSFFVSLCDVSDITTVYYVILRCISSCGVARGLSSVGGVPPTALRLSGRARGARHNLGIVSTQAYTVKRFADK